jgi:phosphohistidine phosphatase
MAGGRRRLSLLRHAKSSWSDAGLDDFDRPLNSRGKHDAPMMGRRLLERGARPSLIVTSPAKRARATAKKIAKTLNYPQEFLQSDKELYLASPEQILAVIARQDDQFQDIMVVGHNPGLTELASQLSGRYIDNIPTTGVVCLETEADSWSDLAKAACNLLYFDYPKARGESDTA